MEINYESLKINCCKLNRAQSLKQVRNSMFLNFVDRHRIWPGMDFHFA